MANRTGGKQRNEETNQSEEEEEAVHNHSTRKLTNKPNSIGCCLLLSSNLTQAGKTPKSPIGLAIGFSSAIAATVIFYWRLVLIIITEC